jgi:uncharacterized membrane protein (UPF0182 family)
LKTREAYNVIVKRIEAKNMAGNRRIWWAQLLVYGSIPQFFFVAIFTRDIFMIILPFILIGIIALICALKKFPLLRARMKIKEDEEVKEVAILRRDAAGPSSALQLPDWLQERQNKRSGGTTFNDSPKYYVRAAACGAVSNTG